MAKLILVLVVLGLAAQSLAAPRPLQRFFPRIVGGEEVAPGSIPFQISLQYFGSHICGGSILNAEWIVTAAHCAVLGSTSSYSIRAGVHNIRFPEADSQESNVVLNIVHEAYNSGIFENDIALMKLATPLRISEADRTATIELVPSGLDVTGLLGTVSGWGTVESGGLSPAKLRAVEVPFVSDDECRNAYGASAILESMVCAGLKLGGQDSCQGDSGGPLTAVVSDKTWLAGIVSWGRGCALPDYYGVYTEASYFNDWVADKLANN